MNLFKKSLAAAAVAFLGLTGLVASQTIQVPQVSLINLTDLVQVIPNGQPSSQSVYSSVKKLNAVRGYYKAVVISGFTYTFDNDVTLAAFRPGGTINYGYVTMAPAPSDGTEACIFTINTITTLYLTANTGQSINNAITTLAANTRACYIYGSSNATWDRSQ